MKTEQNVHAESAGGTEADWASATQSSTDLPKFVEEDFDLLIDGGGKLRLHMTKLLEAGGKDRSPGAAAEDSSSMIQRITGRIAGS